MKNAPGGEDTLHAKAKCHKRQLLCVNVAWRYILCFLEITDI